VALDDDGAVVPDPAKARPLQRITHVNPNPDQPDRVRMPRFRLPVPDERVAYLRQWVALGAPDGDPAGQVVETEPEPHLAPGPVVGPPAGVPGFAADIAPLFRPVDIDSMQDSFDLASFEDVRANAQIILDAVATEFMPCDEPWPPERVDLFRRWVDGGILP
jgi:hypothetical protein